MTKKCVKKLWEFRGKNAGSEKGLKPMILTTKKNHLKCV